MELGLGQGKRMEWGLGQGQGLLTGAGIVDWGRNTGLVQFLWFVHMTSAPDTKALRGPHTPQQDQEFWMRKPEEVCPFSAVKQREWTGLTLS